MMADAEPAQEFLSVDSAARVRRAASGRAHPAELRELTADPDVLVRAAVAINRSCAPELDQLLATDEDERVRALLAGRIARLLPQCVGPEQTDAADRAHRTLIALAQDEAVRVRAAIADAVKDMPQAPRELIMRLAYDTVLEVCDPIVRLSPVLTDADLLALLATPPHPSVPMSVAARPRLSTAITDAIADHASVPVVRAMLDNPSASIREATLDGLIGRAAAHCDWHGPLVRRPALSAAAVRQLSLVVTAQLLEVLATRTDLDPSVLPMIRARVKARLKQGGVEEREDRALIIDLLRLKKAHALDECVLMKAAHAGETRRVAAILAVSCDVPLSAIDRVVGLRSAKALVSLVWRAGFSMQAGMAVQIVLGHLGPASILPPTADDAFPLSEDEMRWQLDLLVETTHRPNPPEYRGSASFVADAASAA